MAGDCCIFKFLRRIVDVSFSFVRLVIDSEFRHNIVKVADRLESADYFDNVMTKFIVNIRTYT